MDLKTAIESGKPFKRPNWRPGPRDATPWVINLLGHGKIRFLSFPHNEWTPMSRDLTANDYEVREDKDTEEKIVQDLANAKTINQITELIGRAQKLLQLDIPF